METGSPSNSTVMVQEGKKSIQNSIVMHNVTLELKHFKISETKNLWAKSLYYWKKTREIYETERKT